MFSDVDIFCENQIFLKKTHITSAVGDSALSWSHTGQLRSYLLSNPLDCTALVYSSDCTAIASHHFTAVTELL